MDKEQEKWAIFWCDLLSPVIYDEIEPQLTNRFLKQLARKITMVALKEVIEGKVQFKRTDSNQ